MLLPLLVVLQAVLQAVTAAGKAATSRQLHADSCGVVLHQGLMGQLLSMVGMSAQLMASSRFVHCQAITCLVDIISTLGCN